MNSISLVLFRLSFVCRCVFVCVLNLQCGKCTLQSSYTKWKRDAISSAHKTAHKRHTRLRTLRLVLSPIDVEMGEHSRVTFTVVS